MTKHPIYNQKHQAKSSKPAAGTGNALWMVAILVVAVACSEEDPQPREVVLTPIDAYTSIDETTGTIYIRDLPGSIDNTYSSGFLSMFFNLEGHRVINPYDEDSTLLELPEEQQASADWDLAFTEVYNSYITINNGEIEASPGKGGPGKGKLIVLDALFDELDQAPTEAAFDAFMEEQTATGWEDFPPGDKGWYFYSLDSHIMSPISGVTIVIKTAEGNYAKLEMGSLYLGSPENPTVNTPAPYFNFRYYLQTDGSRNLKTR